MHSHLSNEGTGWNTRGFINKKFPPARLIRLKIASKGAKSQKSTSEVAHLLDIKSRKLSLKLSVIITSKMGRY